MDYRKINRERRMERDRKRMRKSGRSVRLLWQLTLEKSEAVAAKGLSESPSGRVPGTQRQTRDNSGDGSSIK